MYSLVVLMVFKSPMYKTKQAKEDVEEDNGFQETTNRFQGPYSTD